MDQQYERGCNNLLIGYTAPSAKFTDIGAHWGKESIDYVVGRGLLAGTSETTFAPNTAMTRGMLVTALGRLKTGWVKDGGNWRFYSGNRALVGWWDIGSGDEKKTYYFDAHANMTSSKWLELDGKWYYFNVDGSLVKSTTVDGYKVDENGIRNTE